MTRRRKDWVHVLLQTIEQAKDIPFAWGSQDCALFAADCVLAMTGVDFAEEFRGKYNDQEGALRLIRGDLESVLMSKLGEPLSRRFAGRGDVVLFEATEGPAVGVVGVKGTNIYAVTEEGLVELPISRALKCWKIG